MKMEVFAARFPVFDPGKEVYGYELTFRSGFETYYQALQANKSRRDKTNVDFMAFVDFGELSGGKRGFVEFSPQLLMMDFPLLFSPQSMIACLPADSAPDEPLLDRCRDLKARGYLLALSDFTTSGLSSPLSELADIVKVNADQASQDDQRAICSWCAARGSKALAKGLGSQEQYSGALAEGYTLFQGEFFSTPAPKAGKEIASNKLICLRVIREVNQTELNYDEVAKLVERDVSMTYTLLRLINSAWFGLKYEVKSVRQAIVLLGPAEIRRWASMVAMNKAVEDKPSELLRLALTRAKFAEQIAIMAGMKKQAPELYLMGMFSILDALMDLPMEQVLAEVALAERIKKALLGGDGGEYRHIYETMLAYEHGQWVLFADLAKAMRIQESAVPDAFKKSLAWADHALKAE